MKVAIFEVEDWEKKYLEENLPQEFEAVYFGHTLTDDALSKIQDVEVLVVFIYSNITREVLSRLPNLKFIATMSTGFDHIDMEECKSRGIVVSNVAGYGEITVAEHTFALILSLSRRIIESYERVKDGYFSPENLTGYDLAGKTLGVVGVGSIGTHVIEIAHGFRMNVLGFKRTPDPELERKLNFKIVDLDTLFKESDVISLHLPYTEETHHIVNHDAFEKMRKGAVLINTARGALIDTKELLEFIENGKLRGAGLDVYEGEPMLREEKQLLSREFDKEELLSILQEKMLLSHKNVVITPHNAFNSFEALEKILSTTIQNLASFKTGNPQNKVEK